MGLELEGDSDNKAWGVMDLLLVTDFPDIRVKSLVESARDGTLMIIPREGGHLVRLYVELEQLAPGQRIRRVDVSLDQLIGAAERILQPYTLTVREVPWWSVYEVGQRLCPVFDNRDMVPDDGHPNVFIVGDACHTHSPKAGQGMNVSMHDSFNLGWKLASVAQGLSQPELLLSYSDERQTIARELIDFDRHLARLFSAAGDSGANEDKTALQNALLAADGFVSGTTCEYGPSATVRRNTQQQLARGLTIGRRLPPLSLLRAVDACPLRLNETLLADGRWRIICFDRESRDAQLSDELTKLLIALDSSTESPRAGTRPTGRISTASLSCWWCYPGLSPNRSDRLPNLLWPSKGKLALRDYGKVFAPDHGRIGMLQTGSIMTGAVSFGATRPACRSDLRTHRLVLTGEFLLGFHGPGQYPALTTAPIKRLTTRQPGKLNAITGEAPRTPGKQRRREPAATNHAAGTHVAPQFGQRPVTAWVTEHLITRAISC